MPPQAALADEEELRKQREEERQRLAQERMAQAYAELQVRCTGCTRSSLAFAGSACLVHVLFSVVD